MAPIKNFSALLVIFSLAALYPSNASAESSGVIYNNGAPLHTGETNNIAYFIGAEDFTLVSTQTIQNVRVWLYGDSGYAGSIAWDIYANSPSNAPGNVLASGNATDAAFTATGFVWPDGTPEYTMDFSIAPFNAVAATTYWLGIRNAVPNPANYPVNIPPFNWELTNNANGTLISYFYGYGCCGASTGWYQLRYVSSGTDSGGEHAFELLGAGTAACSYTLSQTSQAFSAAGGTLTVSVTAPSGCAWSVSSLPSWIKVSGNGSGTGSGTLTLNVAANTGAARTSTFPVGGVSLTINQSAGTVTCSSTLDKSSESFPAGGGTLTISITAASGCAWTVSGNPSWITVSGNASGTGSGTLTLNIAADTGAARSSTVLVGGASLTISQSGGAPAITDNGIVPVDSSVPVIQTGSWISIYGTGLSNGTSIWAGDFPTSLGGVSVTINSKPAYLSYVSPTQINVQAPDDTATGTVSAVVTNSIGSATSTVTLSQFGPSFSLFDNKYAAGVIAMPNGGGAYGNGTYDLLGPSGRFTFNTRPVKPGEAVELYGFGFGPTDPTVPAGRPFSGAAPTTNPVTVTVGGVSAKVLFSGISQAGVYQINLVIPNLGSGDQLLQATVGGVQTQNNIFVAVE